jgi:hypothetical protein
VRATAHSCCTGLSHGIGSVEEREAVVVEERRYSSLGRRLITCQYVTIRDIKRETTVRYERTVLSTDYGQTPGPVTHVYRLYTDSSTLTSKPIQVQV